MYSFTNDYSEGAHPLVLQALQDSNLEQSAGYGLDTYSQKATARIQELLQQPDVDIHYLVGGTQTNATIIAATLQPYQAVIAADTGHIYVHETGAIEATGHKVIACSHREGKVTIEMIAKVLETHSSEHMVEPKMVYISQTTELGTAYTTTEIETLYTYCQQQQLYLFMDGARLGSALSIPNCPSLQTIAKNCDAFSIGGTKMGALLGECLVIRNPHMKPKFRYHMKQRGALLAKGRIIGIQFLALFTNHLYFRIGEHENAMAMQLQKGIENLGYSFYILTKSNQIFPIFPNTVITELQKSFQFLVMSKVDKTQSYVRLVTSWATTKEQIEKFIYILEKIGKDSNS